MPAGRLERLLAPLSCLLVLCPAVALMHTGGPRAQEAPQEAPRLAVGLVLDSTGPKASLSEALKSAIDAEVSRLSGTPGINVSLHVETDGCTAGGGAEAARRLVARQVALVLGHPCANAALAAAKVYAAAGTPFVAVGVRHPDLTDRRAGPQVYRLAGRDDRQATDTVRLLSAELTGKRIAIIHDRTRYARRLADEVAARLMPIAAALTTYPVVAGERGYDGLVAALRMSRPDAVYFAVFPPEGALIAKELASPKSSTLFIFADLIPADFISANGLTTEIDAISIQSTTRTGEKAIAERAAGILADAAGRHGADTAWAAALGADPSGDIPTLSYQAIRAARP